MYLLGSYLPDQKLVRIALTTFYGISHQTARRLCARLQLHELATVSSLNEAQITALSAYLSSPSSIPARKAESTSAFPIINGSQSSITKASEYENLPASQQTSPEKDPLRSLVLESDLRRELRANLSHHRTIGSYVGRRHVAGLPVRGQKTRTNAITAGKLNRIERRGLATFASPTTNPKSVSELVQPLLREKFNRD